MDDLNYGYCADGDLDFCIVLKGIPNDAIICNDEKCGGQCEDGYVRLNGYDLTLLDGTGDCGGVAGDWQICSDFGEIDLTSPCQSEIEIKINGSEPLEVTKVDAQLCIEDEAQFDGFTLASYWYYCSATVFRIPSVIVDRRPDDVKTWSFFASVANRHVDRRHHHGYKESVEGAPLWWDARCSVFREGQDPEWYDCGYDPGDVGNAAYIPKDAVRIFYGADIIDMLEDPDYCPGVDWDTEFIRCDFTGYVGLPVNDVDVDAFQKDKGLSEGRSRTRVNVLFFTGIAPELNFGFEWHGGKDGEKCGSLGCIEKFLDAWINIDMNERRDWTN
jgi:hypothetical protein